jgi:cytochrome c-type biogenesis protein CcmH/NrfG
VWVWLGWNSTSLEESEAAFQRAYDINPDSEEARLGLRWVSSQRDSQPDAASASTSMAEAESASPALNIEEQMQVGIGAVEAGDKAAAYSSFRRIVAAEPGLVEAWVWLGGTSTDIEEAESAFRRATELDPNNEKARLGLRWVALRRQVLQQPSPEDQPEEAPSQAVQIGGFRPYDTGELARRDMKPAPPPEEKKQGFFSKLFGRRK